MLKAGLARFSPALRQDVLRYVLARHSRDGGFPGRRGGSDLYYTEFATRVMILLDCPREHLERVLAWLVGTRPTPATVVDCFSLLNLQRMLTMRGLNFAPDRDQLLGCIARCALPSGGWAGVPAGPLSAYTTFIAALCLQMLDEPVDLRAAAAALKGLEQPAGGYVEAAGEPVAQTSATAAVLSFLEASGLSGPGLRQPAAGLLASMQASDGGLKAWAGAASGDLLSTFTALLALGLAGSASCLDLPALGRFVRDCAGPGGGFGAYPGDRQTDVEYTYYGLGTLALLAGIAAGG
ncbi:MAG: terpene cyclase/mutase family protein [Armatimonadetes bacterium]|nr:terpene cyclase/mutase family protein [Armatimonadota bacterium]MDI9585088.1 terpene cyclase/mutase family protein [Acidobacteriota bacterium]